jgi:hypothetical protein
MERGEHGGTFGMATREVMADDDACRSVWVEYGDAFELGDLVRVTLVRLLQAEPSLTSQIAHHDCVHDQSATGTQTTKGSAG